MTYEEDEARKELLRQIKARANSSSQKPIIAELRQLAEVFALVTGNVAASALSADQLAELLAARGKRR